MAHRLMQDTETKRKELGWPTWDARKAEQALAEGLVDGNRFSIGSHVIAAVVGDELVLERNGQELNRVPLSSLTEQEADRLLVNKAAAVGSSGHSIGH